MSTDKATMARLLNITLAAYPSQRVKLGTDEIKDMALVWQQSLADLPADALGMAIRAHIETSQWLPSVAEIRAQVVRLRRAGSTMNQTAIEAWGDVLDAYRTTGYFDTPRFANPITQEVVNRMGWRRMCEDDSPEGVQRAQFERYYNALMERHDHDAALSETVHNYIDSQRAQQLTAGVTQALTRRAA